jgi:hypothetical protein
MNTPQEFRKLIESIEVQEAADGPKEQLMDIMEQLRQLSAEAAGIMAEHFPQAHQQGDAYGAFNFGSSNNQYDTSFESILNSLDDESDSNFEDAANELDSLIRSGMDDEQALQKVASEYDVPIEELEDYMGR